MNMESPVRICIGAALVVNLLLITSTTVGANTLSIESNTTTARYERNPKHSRNNTTIWAARNRSKLPDVALNELHPKDSTSEEHTEKNAKYKDRGRVKFNIQSKTTKNPVTRISSTTKTPDVIIITPTPEVKKPAQIIDSMRTYKKTKMPVVTIPSTVSSISSTKSETQSQEISEGDEVNNESFEKYTSSKFHDSSFFNIPNFDDDDDFGSQKFKRGYNKNAKPSTPAFGSFSSFFPKDVYSTKDESHKSDTFFDFNSDLTTPKNDFFDKKFQEISSSILNNLDTIKSKSPPPNMTNVHKVVQENIGFEKLNNNTPTNKSSVFIKNTKEIRYLDNDHASSANKELSDVHGTSIYYEMTVLSTETYNIKDINDDDCDSDTQKYDVTASTPLKEELASLKASKPTGVEVSTKANTLDSELSPFSISTLSTNFSPFTMGDTVLSSLGSMPVSTQNSNTVSSTEASKIISSSNNRNKNYSKRLNLSGAKDSPNSVYSTLQTELAANLANQGNRPQTRRFHYTTPKIKPIWMAPKRNITKSNTRVPTTIYSEHFDIKDKIFSTHKPRMPLRTILTTQPSDIDPVLQTDISGTKKIVNSQSISDNTIPSLWKRGSTKFSLSTTASTERTSGISDLEIPPTLTAWALASLRSPPSLSSPVVNGTGSTQKSVDENELQKVGELIDKKETTTSSTTTTAATIASNDFVTKNITEIYQNRLPWKPILPTTSHFEDDSKDKPTESMSERLPAESNISVQSSKEPITTEAMKINAEVTTKTSKDIENETYWIPVTSDLDQATTDEVMNITKTETLSPVESTKVTGFESITKLPAGITTPKDETAEDKNETDAKETNKIPVTTDYEITTIRFSYVPTEAIPTDTEPEDATDWHPVFPTRTRATTIQDSPITTYRPKYITTTDVSDETTTYIIETTPQLEVSSQIEEQSTQKENITTTEPTEETTQTTNPPTTLPVSTTKINTMKTEPTTTEVESTTPIETTTIIVTVATEINSERVPLSSFVPTEIVTEIVTEDQTDRTSEQNSDSNEVITQDSKPISTTAESTTNTQKVETTTEYRTPTIMIHSTTETITTTDKEAKIFESTTTITTTDEVTTDMSTRSVNELEDLSSYAGDVTTEAGFRVIAEEAGSGAAIAIAVSTIGVIALVLLVGLLLVVRRRGRRGVYAQRCTPVSLDAYSLDSVSVGHRKGNHRLRASKRSYGNPAYDDEVTSHPMQYAALANFALDIDSITAEFTEIPSVSVRPDEVPSGCEDKNRYSNVLPLPETRVPLKRIGNDPTSEYINANFITGPGNIRNYYIACQAPLANTVIDFWRMIWEQNSRLVVMLTEYMENGVEKCYEYLPPSEISDNKRTFGEYQIILKKREQRDKYAISSVQLINLTTRTWREITHLWYFWPAKGVPEDYDSVIDFLSEMRSYMKISQTAKEYDEEGVEVIYEDQNRSSYNNLSKLRSDENGSSNGVNVYSPARAEELMRRTTNGTLGRMKAASEIEGVRPCVVVCASGAGRSAALIAAELCSRSLAGGRVDVPRTVRRLRDQRPHSLANRHHYIFLYKLLSEYGNKLMGGGVDTI